MKNIGKKKMLEIPIPVPPINLQQQFSEIVRAVEEQRRTVQTHLNELHRFFASLQARAFSGQL